MPLFAPLLLLAQEMPALTCQKDEAGQCILALDPAPMKRVHRLHAKALADFYQSYYECYARHLFADEAFGTQDGKLGIAAMQGSREACVEQLVPADAQADAYLAQQGIYGDAANRRRVIDTFRQETGALYVERQSRALGLHVQFKTMVQAIIDELVPPND